VILAGTLVLLLVTGTALLALVRLALRVRWSPCAVARTFLAEALAQRASLILIGLVLALLCTLPAILDADQPLRYRVQTFLSHGLGGAGALLSLLTIFLGSWSLAEEQRSRRIHVVATRPISRTAILAGKWLGLVLLDLVLLAVVGLAMYLLTVHHLAEQPARDDHDARALQEEVLTARLAVQPELPPNLEAVVERDLQAADPELVRRAGGEAAARQQLTNQALARWRSLGPGHSRTFRFTSLQAAAGHEFVQLRYRVEVSRPVEHDRVWVQVRLNDRPARLPLTVDQVQVVPVPARWLTPDGELELVIHNSEPGAPTLTFAGGDTGLLVLYPAGSFELNLVRALLAIWIRLVFLAALVLAAATFLSFPVAASLGLLVLLASSLAGVLVEVTPGTGAGGPGLILGAICHAVGTALQQYVRVAPAASLAEGHLVPWSEVLRMAWWIGVVWSGVTGALGACILQRRELARVQV
jgi:hypothetical protein